MYFFQLKIDICKIWLSVLFLFIEYLVENTISRKLTLYFNPLRCGNGCTFLVISFEAFVAQQSMIYHFNFGKIAHLLTFSMLLLYRYFVKLTSYTVIILIKTLNESSWINFIIKFDYLGGF